MILVTPAARHMSDTGISLKATFYLLFQSLVPWREKAIARDEAELKAHSGKTCYTQKGVERLSAGSRVVDRAKIQ